MDRGNDENVSNARVFQRLKSVHNHRLIIYWKEVFINNFSAWEQSGAGSTGQNNSFHYPYNVIFLKKIKPKDGNFDRLHLFVFSKIGKFFV